MCDWAQDVVIKVDPAWLPSGIHVLFQTESHISLLSDNAVPNLGWPEQKLHLI